MLDEQKLYTEIKQAFDMVRDATEKSKGKQSQQKLDDLFAKELAGGIYRFIVSGDVRTVLTATSPSGPVNGFGDGKVV